MLSNRMPSDKNYLQMRKEAIIARSLIECEINVGECAAGFLKECETDVIKPGAMWMVISVGCMTGCETDVIRTRMKYVV